MATSAIPSLAGISLYFLSLSVGILPATILGHSVGTLDSEPFVCIIVVFEGRSMFCTLLSSPFCSSSHFLPGVFNGLLLPLSLSKPFHASSPGPPSMKPFPPSRLLPHVPFGAPQASSPNHRLHARLLFTPLFPTEQV